MSFQEKLNSQTATAKDYYHELNIIFDYEAPRFLRKCLSSCGKLEQVQTGTTPNNALRSYFKCNPSKPFPKIGQEQRK